jgi:3-methyladenine DNA glycosylase AlkD
MLLRSHKYGGNMPVKRELIKTLTETFKKYDTPENKMDYQRWFKEELKHPISFRGPIIKKIANELFKQAKEISKEELLDTCEAIYESDRPGESGVAAIWISRISRQFTGSDFSRFESWLKKYVDNWGRCDTFCAGFFGELILMYPDLVFKTLEWARSKNRWFRRASAVILIPSLKKGRQLEKAFEVADILLMDDDDMVQKGYGWMLKVAADKYQDDVYRYVLKNKAGMPRTALRYAIEKMPDTMRKKVME